MNSHVLQHVEMYDGTSASRGAMTHPWSLQSRVFTQPNRVVESLRPEFGLEEHP